ncbi:unnamed protein product [Pleuronectes platessa]|uniref:Uncharacterized protein n=1 Tax=Pleuronectes platessa TaxID=8262 RepID=A0A9N7VB50_PLEPL|nr:unnamed protein product [Pleuronectes platessa]
MKWKAWQRHPNWEEKARWEKGRGNEVNYPRDHKWVHQQTTNRRENTAKHKPGHSRSRHWAAVAEQPINATTAAVRQGSAVRCRRAGRASRTREGGGKRVKSRESGHGTAHSVAGHMPGPRWRGTSDWTSAAVCVGRVVNGAGENSNCQRREGRRHAEQAHAAAAGGTVSVPQPAALTHTAAPHSSEGQHGAWHHLQPVPTQAAAGWPPAAAQKPIHQDGCRGVVRACRVKEAADKGGEERQATGPQHAREGKWGRGCSPGGVEGGAQREGGADAGHSGGRE